MAILARALDLFSEGMAYPRPRAALVSRVLREEKVRESLIPHDPVGRNKGTHLSPSHLLNLMIGMAAADPIANAPAIVRAYRHAGYVQPLEEIFGKRPEQKPILPGQGLGLDLDSLIDLLAKPSRREQDIRRSFAEDFRVTLFVGEAVVATVERPAFGLVNQYAAHSTAQRQEEDNPRPVFQMYGKTQPVVALRRIVHLDFSHFEIAAELWADSLKHGAVYQPSLLDPDSGPENETAASDPGKDQNAAAQRDQPATGLDGPTQRHPTGGREKSQPSSTSRADRSRQFYRSGSHAERQHWAAQAPA